jgi:16S rRNA G1207 methylase RsmC
MIARTESRRSTSTRSGSVLLKTRRDLGFVARPKQSIRLLERRSTELIQVSVQGVEFDVFKGVYDTGIDTELMLRTVHVDKTETFLEVGCGAGAVSILVAGRCKGGIGVDINPLAVENSQHNAKAHGVENIEFRHSDVFEAVREHFDVIICNPPYNAYRARDFIDMMFWDPANRMKRRFFDGVCSRLRPSGRIYFGWSDFADISSDYPINMANDNGLKLADVRMQQSGSGEYRFLVLKFVRK